MTHFACLGSKCEDTCCQNWDIYIDREHYEKLADCIKNDDAGKKKFDDQSEALKVVWRMKSEGESVHAYRCKFCTGWHVGHYHKPTHKMELSKGNWYDY